MAIGTSNRAPMRSLVTLIVCCIALLSVGAKSAFARTHVTALYTFGDSFVEIGNNVQLNQVPQGGYPPYGVSFGYNGRTVPGNGRWSNGKLLVDFLAEDLQIDGYPLPWFDIELRGPDNTVYPGFSFASTSYLMDEDTPRRGEYLPLRSQVEIYTREMRNLLLPALQRNMDRVNDHVRRSIFYISYGTDRFLQELLLNMQFDESIASSVADAIHQEISTALYSLSDAGAQYFIVTEMPAVGCMPYVRNHIGDKGARCNDKVNGLVKKFNNVLEDMLYSFVRSRPEMKVFLGPMYKVTFAATRNAGDGHTFTASGACCPQTSYSYRNNIACSRELSICDNPSRRPWFDGVHPSEHMQHIIERRFFRPHKDYQAPTWTYRNINEMLSDNGY